MPLRHAQRFVQRPNLRKSAANLPKSAPAGVGLEGPRHRRAWDPYARARLTDAMRRSDDQMSA